MEATSAGASWHLASEPTTTAFCCGGCGCSSCSSNGAGSRCALQSACSKYVLLDPIQTNERIYP